MKALVPFIASICAAGGFAEAGVVVETLERDLPGGRETAFTTIQIEDGRMRVDTLESGEKSPDHTTIFTGDALIGVDHDRKTYTSMDRETLQRLAGQMNQAMKEMEAQLAGMPPEQRAMVEKMVGRSLGGTPTRVALELTRTGRTETVGGYSCQVWEGRREGQKMAEHCIVPYAKLTGGAEIGEAMKNMVGMMEELLAAIDSAWLQGMVRQEWEGLRKIDGYPVISRTFDRGEPTSEFVLRSTRSAPVGAARFEPPAGYRRKDITP